MGLRVLTRLGVAQEKKSYAATYRAVQAAAGEFGERDYDLLITANAVLARHGPRDLQADCAAVRALRDQTLLRLLPK